MIYTLKKYFYQYSWHILACKILFVEYLLLKY